MNTNVPEWHAMRLQPLLALVLVATLATGCATPGETLPPAEVDPDVTTAETPPAVTAREAEPVKPPEYPVAPFDKEMLYNLLVAEVAGFRGDFEASLERYVQAAIETRDPGVAARATRLAAYLKRDDDARRTALIWVEVDPDNIDAHRHAADQLMRIGDLQGAIKHMDAVKRMGGFANFELFAYRAQALGPEARSSLLQSLASMVDRYPDDEQLRLARAILLRDSGAHEEALVIVEGLLGPAATPNLVVLKADLLNRLDRRPEAVAFLRERIAAAPDDRRMRLTLARFLFEEEAFDAAKAEYRAVLERSPADGDVLFALALISMEQNLDDDAMGYLEDMIRRNRRAGEAHYYLGSLLEKRGEIPRALAEYRRVGRGYEFLPAQGRIASLLFDAGRVDDARTWLETMRAEAPSFFGELVVLEAQLLANRGLKDALFTFIDGAIANDPENIEYLYFRAMAGQQFDDLSILERDLRHVIEIDPDNADALNALGYTLADQTSRFEEARELIARALALKPDEPAFIDSMGWVEYRLGNLAEAKRHLRRALDLFPNDEVAAHLGEVLWVMGDQAAANAVWDEALDRTPDSLILKEVMRRLRQ